MSLWPETASTRFKALKLSISGGVFCCNDIDSVASYAIAALFNRSRSTSWKVYRHLRLQLSTSVAAQQWTPLAASCGCSWKGCRCVERISATGSSELCSRQTNSVAMLGTLQSNFRSPESLPGVKYWLVNCSLIGVQRAGEVSAQSVCFMVMLD